MNDKELLELAAKAANIDGLIKGTADGAVWLFRDDNGSPWNPLTDDGDALRLAVALGIKVRWHAVLNQALAWPCAGHTLEVQENGEDHAGDPFAATRRAITRAAAEIGRRM